MLKLIMLVGIIACGGIIGHTGVRVVADRQKVLREIQKDAARLGELIGERGMMLTQALCQVASKSICGRAYRQIVEQIEKNSENQPEPDMIEKCMSVLDLTVEERRTAADFFVKLSECISSREVWQVTDICEKELAGLLKILEEKDMRRALVLKKIWVMGALGAALILI